MAAYVYEDGTGWTPLTTSQLPASGVAAGTYGDSTHVGQFTVSAKGIITAAAAVAISGSGGGGIVQAQQASRTAGDLSTASTVFVDATGLTLTFVTGAHRCLILFSAAGHSGTQGNNVALDVAIDGARQGQTFGLLTAQSTAPGTPNLNLSFTYLTAALSAASHTFKVQWRIDGTDAATMFASAGVTPAILTVIELGI